MVPYLPCSEGDGGAAQPLAIHGQVSGAVPLPLTLLAATIFATQPPPLLPIELFPNTIWCSHNLSFLIF